MLGRAGVLLVELVHPVGVAVVGVAEARNVVALSYFREAGVLVAAYDFVVDGFRVWGLRIDVVQQRAGAVVILVVAGLPPVEPLDGVGDVVEVHGASLDADGAVVVDDGGAFAGALRRYENHAESSAGAIDGCRRCVLEHGDGFDILRVHHIQRAFHSVDEHEGGAAGADGGGAAHVDGSAARGLAVVETDVQTGYLALQRAGEVAVGTVSDHFAVHFVHCADKVAPLHRGVTDDDHVVEDVGRIGKHDVEGHGFGAAQGDFRILISYEGYDEGGGHFQAFDLVAAVQVGDVAAGNAFYLDGGPYQGLSCRIEHAA